MADHVSEQHFGQRALHLIHKMLELDEVYTQTHEDGFSWWPGEVPVRFRWRAPVLGEGLPVWRLSVEIEAADRLERASELDRTKLALMNVVLNQCAIVIEDGVLKLRALVYATPEGDTSWLAQLIYRAAFMARTAKEVVPASLKVFSGRRLLGFGGPRLIHRPHPVAGLRREPATQLDAFLDAAVQVGSAPSPLDRRPDLGAAMIALRQAGCDKVAGPPEDEGLHDVQSFNVVIETRHATALLELRLNEASPNVGQGLLAVLRVRFPEGHVHGDSHGLARELNTAEWNTDKALHIQGAWTATAKGADVAYSAFFPNVLHYPALGREVALDGLRRVRWVFDHFGYTEPFSREGPYVNQLLGTPGTAGMEA